MSKNELHAFADQFADQFGLKGARSLSAKPLGHATLSVVQIFTPGSPETTLFSLPPDEAFLITLYLKDANHRDVVPPPLNTPYRNYSKGSICLIDLGAGAGIEIQGDFDVLAFHIPYECLAEFAHYLSCDKAIRLRTCRGIHDEVIHHLGQALLAMLGSFPRDVAPLLEQIFRALGAHLVHTYSLDSSPSPSHSGTFH
jgi:hypothetical protein